MMQFSTWMRFFPEVMTIWNLQVSSGGSHLYLRIRLTDGRGGEKDEANQCSCLLDAIGAHSTATLFARPLFLSISDPCPLCYCLCIRQRIPAVATVVSSAAMGPLLPFFSSFSSPFSFAVGGKGARERVRASASERGALR